MTPPTYTAFFYGTLMAPPVLHRVIHGTSRPSAEEASRTTFTPALLQEFRRHRVAGCDYPAIRPHAGSTVRGSLVSGLEAIDLMRLDIFEGDQYDRRDVKVRVLKGVGLEESMSEHSNGRGGEVTKQEDAQQGEEVETETYIFREVYWDDLETEEWDFEEFKREKMMFWMGETGWSGGEHDGTGDGDMENGVEIDSGFADVDRAVAEGKVGGSPGVKQENAKVKDPTGGRGLNGSISKQLQDLGKP